MFAVYCEISATSTDVQKICYNLIKISQSVLREKHYNFFEFLVKIVKIQFTNFLKEVFMEEKDWYEYEKIAQKSGYTAICGIDEAGRGPLAGPVFAAAVILPINLHIDGLNDSKKISEKKREALFPIIQEKAIAFSIAFATEKEIDELNILNATFLAMQRAFYALSTTADFALVDGNRDPKLPVPTQLVVKGDSKSASIAAASILAKVSRDRFMLELSKKYPEYEFQKHKGYGTKLHTDLLKKYGPSCVHRQTFLTKILKNNV